MEGRKGKAIAFRERQKQQGESYRRKKGRQGARYHLSSSCLPAKQPANAIQFAWWKAFLLSFLESRPRSASCRHSYAANFLPVAPFLLIPTLALAKLPFHESLPWSLQFSFLLLHLPFFASRYLFSLTRQRFLVSSFVPKTCSFAFERIIGLATATRFSNQGREAEKERNREKDEHDWSLKRSDSMRR